MEILYFLERIRVPILNEIMLAITYFGDETVLLAVAMCILWCVDKRRGYCILTVGGFGLIANQFLKMIFKIPRPWVRDPSFPVSERAKERAIGYSFPSGHTQNAVAIYGIIALKTRKRAVRIAAIVFAVLVFFSRMYLGVHTPMDVGVSALMALALIAVVNAVLYAKDGKYFSVLLGVLAAMSIALCAFVLFSPQALSADEANLASARENAFTILGTMCGVICTYIADKKWTKFPTEAVWWAQIIKLIVGLLLVLAVKSATKDLLNAAFGELIGRAVRYFLIALVGGVLWPMTFKKFSTLGKKE